MKSYVSCKDYGMIVVDFVLEERGNLGWKSGKIKETDPDKLTL
jgi:hypothetical protein